ncbi:amine oxidase [Ferroglobus placidus DSM 10642]|uniref:Amine oxidase n=1 Tax=Ferroglobus placidus (strain DSM 10642 / AEDII12DO) TaxID=589924 RepID=D3S1K0_FERPA|nr:NAD(P)/FAD-dependent oxidoreductase [Ferroglobus placidus]ADC66464.1 amine oxidase [Ferroglobus placidus DSM 10642]
MKIAVVGAGLSGLNAARILSEYAKVVVFEKKEVGGLLSSLCNSYCVEKFYHHCFKQDDYLLEVLRELNLHSKLKWRVVKVGQEYEGKIYSLSTPLEILRYPGMSFFDKVKLAKFTISAKKKNYEEFDNKSVVEGIKEELGEKLYRSFFLPLLRSKFGDNYEEVSYAWLLARVSIRSNRKLRGEELGYLKGGFAQLVEKLSENLEIKFENAKIEKGGKWTVNGESFDAVIFTAPLPELNLSFNLPEIKFQSSICALIAAEEKVTEDIYWTNFTNAPFGAMIEHTNFMPFEDYGEHLIYLASYTTPEKLYERSDGDLKRIYLSFLEKFGFKEEYVKKFYVFRAKYSGPIYEKGYLKKITPYKLAEGFYYAGLTSETNYPERSMNGSLLAGKKVAEKVIEDLLS